MSLAYSQRRRRTVKRRARPVKRTAKRRTTRTTTRRRRVHRQADVFNTSGPEYADYKTGATVFPGPSGYGFTRAIASMFQGRNEVQPYGLRPAPVPAAAPAAAAATDAPAAAAGGEAVAQQRRVRAAMQRILRSL